eukprot:16876_1
MVLLARRSPLDTLLYYNIYTDGISWSVYVSRPLHNTTQKYISSHLQTANNQTICRNINNCLYQFISYNILSLMAIFHFFVIGSIDPSTKCGLLAVTNGITYQTAKASMYIVFIGRIHNVYSPSAYGYNPMLMFVIVLILIIITAVIVVFEISFHEYNYVLYSFGTYAMHCNVNYAFFVQMMVASFDLIMCFSTALAFIRPLIKIYKSRKTSTLDVSKMRTLQRLINIGQKYAILTCTAVLSTVLLLLWVGITDTLLLLSYDVVINCICIALMTPYYKDEQYQRVCCCCNKCARMCCLMQMSSSNMQLVVSKTKDADSTINTGFSNS